MTSDNEYHQLLPLFKSGNKANAALASSIATGLDVDLLELLAPFKQLLPQSTPTLEDYYKLFASNRLDWSKSQLIYIPKLVSELQNIEKIYLSDNLLSNVDVLLMLPNVRFVFLDKNKLEFLPNNLGNWPKLEGLFLADNTIKELPKEIGYWKHLQTLDLSRNKLKTLPSSVWGWTSIQHIHLVRNQLLYLPDEIEAWQQLEWLDLSYNQIRELPTSIGQLKNLRRLDLTYNPIESLPDELGQLNLLEELVLHEVPVSALELERITELLPNTKIKVNFDYFF